MVKFFAENRFIIVSDAKSQFSIHNLIRYSLSISLIDLDNIRNRNLQKINQKPNLILVKSSYSKQIRSS